MHLLLWKPEPSFNFEQLQTSEQHEDYCVTTGMSIVRCYCKVTQHFSVCLNFRRSKRCSGLRWCQGKTAEDRLR